MKTICVGRGGGISILEKCGLHNVHSHEEDCSKYFKYEQIISLSEAAITVLNLSGSAIRRNMLLHDTTHDDDSPIMTIGAEHSRSVIRRVRYASKNLTTKHLGGFMIADRFSSLTEFCIRSPWSELVRKHNDPAIDCHLPLYEYVVIGCDLIAARDVVRIDLPSLWMLAMHSVPSLLLDRFFSFVQTSVSRHW
jgi:hypothetical protein